MLYSLDKITFILQSLLIQNAFLGELTTSFTLTCNIKLGTAPTAADCSPERVGRKRREVDGTEFVQSTGTLDSLKKIISFIIKDINLSI